MLYGLNQGQNREKILKLSNKNVNLTKIGEKWLISLRKWAGNYKFFENRRNMQYALLALGDGPDERPWFYLKTANSIMARVAHTSRYFIVLHIHDKQSIRRCTVPSLSFQA